MQASNSYTCTNSRFGITESYCSPEVLRLMFDDEDIMITRKTDIWF